MDSGWHIHRCRRHKVAGAGNLRGFNRGIRHRPRGAAHAGGNWVAVSAPFSMALGDSGCICGAWSGAVLACGLFIGNDQPYHHRQYMRKSARQLHDAFKATKGTTSCRVLSRSVRHDHQAHFQQCAHLTAGTAEMAARLILYQRPELIRCTENRFLHKMDTKIGASMTRLFRIVCLKM
jgi:C_GCAxxG_C_C family probable redox protein